MRSIYSEYFEVPKEGKITEKVMMTRVITTVIFTVMCLVAMSVTAYAYFSHESQSSSYIIQAATWKLDVSAESDVVEENGVYTLDNRYNNENRIFKFTVKKTVDSTATIGYAKLEVNTDPTNSESEWQKFYSQEMGQILPNGGEVWTREVQILVPKGGIAVVKVIPSWGSCALRELVCHDGSVIEPIFAPANLQTLTTGNEQEPQTEEPEATTSESKKEETGAEELEATTAESKKEETGAEEPEAITSESKKEEAGAEETEAAAGDPPTE